jgi:hypothetical protein
LFYRSVPLMCLIRAFDGRRVLKTEAADLILRSGLGIKNDDRVLATNT